VVFKDEYNFIYTLIYKQRISIWLIHIQWNLCWQWLRNSGGQNYRSSKTITFL